MWCEYLSPVDPDPELFECVVEPHRDVLVIRPAGELDVETVSAFNEAVEDLPLDGFGRVILDLRDLEFCDSTGLHAIMALARGISDETSFGIIPGPARVQRVFVVTGLADALPFIDAEGAGSGNS